MNNKQIFRVLIGLMAQIKNANEKATTYHKLTNRRIGLLEKCLEGVLAELRENAVCPNEVLDNIEGILRDGDVGRELKTILAREESDQELMEKEIADIRAIFDSLED